MMETISKYDRAESEVNCGNQFKKSGQIEMAINKYKCAICLFIYSIEDTAKETQKQFYQFRINQVLGLLNEVEKELHQKLSSLNELMQYASIPSNKSQILSHHESESSDIRFTISYPKLNDSNSIIGDVPTVKPTFDGTTIPSNTSTSLGNNIGITIPSNTSTSLGNNIGITMPPPVQPPIPPTPVQPPIPPQTPWPDPPLDPHKPPSHLSDLIININKFKMIRLLGYGSFGVVYLAEEISTGNQFAIKELNSMESCYDQISFLREVEVLSKAVYPAVLHLRGFCFKPNPSIVTEYLPGGSLQDVINGNKQMNKTQRIKALFGVASAMRYLHEKLSIVHRDLKPANIMLNQNLEPVVGDFGLAKIMTEMAMRQTQKAGSPVYMAPELIKGIEYTNKVDVYSFGILCYELLSESLAFAEILDVPSLLAVVIKGDRPDFDNTKIPISACFKELISKCWRDNADKRPSFRDIVRELRKDKYLAGIDKKDFKEYIAILKKANSL